MRYAIYGLMTALCLSGCARAAFDDETRKALAPDVVVYTKEQLARAANELEKNDVPQLREMTKDYCVMRDQARILRGEAPQCVQKGGL